MRSLCGYTNFYRSFKWKEGGSGCEFGNIFNVTITELFIQSIFNYYLIVSAATTVLRWVRDYYR